MIEWVLLIVFIICMVLTLLLVKYRRLFKILFKHWIMKPKGAKFVVTINQDKTVDFAVLVPDRDGRLEIDTASGKQKIVIDKESVFWGTIPEGQLLFVRVGDQFTYNPLAREQKGPDARLTQLTIMQAEELGKAEAKKENKTIEKLIWIIAIASIVGAGVSIINAQMLNEVVSKLGPAAAQIAHAAKAVAVNATRL